MKTFNQLFITMSMLTLIITHSYAQLTHTFEPIPVIDMLDDAWSVTVGSQGTVFLANGYGGLYAYTYDERFKWWKTRYTFNRLTRVYDNAYRCTYLQRGFEIWC